MIGFIEGMYYGIWKIMKEDPLVHMHDVNGFVMNELENGWTNDD